MSGNLTNLRLRLKNTFASFQSLTLADLQDLKWSLRQLIFIEIFQESKLLDEVSEQLQNLSEKREKQLSKWKSAGQSIPKEEKLEFEREYRTSFMSEVLKGLEYTKWPPSLIPFTDLMDDLLHNKITAYDAINHLLNVLFPSSVPPSVPEKRSTPTKQNVSSSPDYSRPADDDSCVPPPPGSVANNTPRNSSPRKPDDSLYSVRIDRESVSEPQKKFGKMEVSYNTSEDVNLSLSSIRNSNVNETTIPLDEYYDTVRAEDKKLVEHLLYQNQILTTQLQHLKASVSKRNQVELTLSSLLQDINKCLLEIVDVGVASSSTASTSTNNSLPSETEARCIECGQAFARANGSTVPSSARTIASTSSQSSSKATSKFVGGGSSASFSWRNVAGKLKQLEGQWTEATRAARQLATSHQSNVSSGSQYFGSTRRISTGFSDSSPSGMSTARSNYSTFSTAGSTSSSNTRNHRDQQNNIRSGKTMAEKARQLVTSAATGHVHSHLQQHSRVNVLDPTLERETPSGFVEGTSRTNALQRECLVLLTALEAWEKIVHDEREQGDILPASHAQYKQQQQRKHLLWLARYEQQSVLQNSVQRLLTLLVSVGSASVLTPDMMQQMASRDTQQTSLSQLVKQVEDDVLPRVKKHPVMQEMWSTLCDSALAEHVLLARFTMQHRRDHQRWQRFARFLIDQIHMFGRTAKQSLEDSFQKLRTMIGIVQDIMKHFICAEEARIPQKSLMSGSTEMKQTKGNSSRASSSADSFVAPIDALCRGVAGEEVAQLMQALRRHHSAFRDMEETLQEMLERFTKSITWEQTNLMNGVKANLGQDLPVMSTIELEKGSIKQAPSSSSGGALAGKPTGSSGKRRRDRPA